MKVFGTVSTPSPGLTPAAISAKRSASVPLLTDTVADLAEFRKCIFKILYRFASYECSGVQCSPKNGDELLLHLQVRTNQIQKRNMSAAHTMRLPLVETPRHSAKGARDHVESDASSRRLTPQRLASSTSAFRCPRDIAGPLLDARRQSHCGEHFW